MTGMDALVHAIEAATNRHATPESNVPAYRAIALVTAHLRDAVREPRDLAARGGMLDAAALGGLAIHKAGHGARPQYRPCARQPGRRSRTASP